MEYQRAAHEVVKFTQVEQNVLSVFLSNGIRQHTISIPFDTPLEAHHWLVDAQLQCVIRGFRRIE